MGQVIDHQRGSPLCTVAVRSLNDEQYREPVPSALEDHGVTEDEWEQFADEASQIIRDHGCLQYSCDSCERSLCCLMVVPVLWTFAIGLLLELKVEIGSHFNVNVDWIVAKGTAFMIPLFIVSSVLTCCYRGSRIGKAMQHDVDELVQRVFTPHGILVYYDRGGEDEPSKWIFYDEDTPPPEQGPVTKCITWSIIVFVMVTVYPTVLFPLLYQGYSCVTSGFMYNRC